MSLRRFDFVTVVSGLPRSGTSMMMQMIEAGGVAVLTDNIRHADDDNYQGYLEFEPVKRTKVDPSWLDDAAGKAVKVVYMLLADLPLNHRYRIVFMQRPYLPDLAQCPHVELVSACDRLPERAKAQAEKFKIPNRYPHVDTMLAGAPFDLLVNLTDMQEHERLNQQAMDHGDGLLSHVQSVFNYYNLHGHDGKQEQRHTIQILGSDGYMGLVGYDWQPHGVELSTRAEPAKKRFSTEKGRFVWEMGALAAAECLASGQEMLVTPEQALHVLEVIQATRESQDTGRRIALTSTFPWPVVA